ncbi:MAG: SDR family NAD(P)-dependent oxidoreductase [Pseudomonadota bacterium]|nr:SDR family NAD(P)-dependent oxidoreductase [Pseudomonadota bacterium]
MTLRFDGKTAIVTGAGNGLGRSHALALAARGAKVVVNDFGGGRDGSGGSSAAAEAVVAEITAAGGAAIANGADVTDAEAVATMVAQTMDACGRIDILINNAGILRDRTFAKITMDDFRKVMEVHLMGSVNCTHAVWPIMREQAYGRIVMTSSSSGLHGNFGQSNYGAAKAGVVGLMNVLVLEGEKYGIRVNTLAPSAATRMTEELMSAEALDLLDPASVTPGVLFLAGEDAPNKTILGAGAGTFSVIEITETTGKWLPEADRTPEAIAAHWASIADPTQRQHLANAGAQTQNMLKQAAAGLGLDLKLDGQLA